MISATLARSWSRSSVRDVAADTSSRKSSSSDLSRKRMVAFRVACMAFSCGTDRRPGGLSAGSTDDKNDRLSYLRSRGLDDFHAGAGPDPRSARGLHGLEIVQRAYAAGSLYAHLRPYDAAHQGDILRGSARRPK